MLRVALAFTIAACGRVGFDVSGDRHDAAPDDGGDGSDSVIDAYDGPRRVTVVGEFGQASANQISVTANFTAGNMVVLLVHWTGNAATVTAVTAAGNTFAVAVPKIVSSGGGAATMYYANDVIGNTSTLIAVSFSANVSFRRLVAIQYTGIRAGNPLEAVDATSGNSLTPSTRPVAVSTRAMIVGDCYTAANQGTATAGAGFSELVIHFGDSLSEERFVTVPGTYLADMQLAVTTDWVMTMAAFAAEP